MSSFPFYNIKVSSPTDGKQLLVLSSGKTLSVFSLGANKEEKLNYQWELVKKLTLPTFIRQIALNHSNELLAVASEDKSLLVYSTSTWENIKST